MNTRAPAVLPRITLLFFASLFFLSLHVLDDAFNTGEPAQYGVSVGEFLFYAGLIYALIPPLGLLLARRGSLIGLVVVTLYAFQAMYGAGLNHVRHMFGDFRGSQFLPGLLSAFRVEVVDIRGYGFGSVLMGMAGLGQTPPHTHSHASSAIAFIDVALNAVLIAFCIVAIAGHLQPRLRPARAGIRADEE